MMSKTDRLHELLILLAGRMRASMLRVRGARIDSKTSIGARVTVRRPRCLTLGRRVVIEHNVFLKIVDDEARLTIGDYTFIGTGSEMDLSGTITIGSHTLIAPNVFITDHAHNMSIDARLDEQGTHIAPVSIGDDVWIGTRAVILPGVVIGNGAVVGAGAVVTRDVPEYCIAAGVPARLIGKRTGSNDRAESNLP